MAEYQTSRWRPALVLLGDMTLPSIAWGMNTLLFVQCANTLRKKVKRRPSQRQPRIMLAFISVLYVLCLAQQVAITIAKSEQPNPSIAVFANIDWERSKCVGVKIGVNLAYFVTTLLTDGLLLWRCWVLYSIRSSRLLRLAIRSLLVALYLGVIGTGVAHLVQELQSPAARTISWFLISSLILNAVFNLFLVVRLLFHRQRIRKLIGPGFGGRYISIVAMILESASVSIFFMVPAVVFPFTLGALFFGIPLLAQTQALGTFLVIHRVAEDKAWNNEDERPVSHAVQFSQATTSTLHETMRSNSDKSRTDNYQYDPDSRISLP